MHTKLYITTFLLAVLVPLSASAITAIVQIDTQGENINAIEARLVLPEGVHIEEVRTGNSVILFWAEPPKVSRDEIPFAGIAPGGFSGVHPLFTIYGEWKGGDLERVQFLKVSALKNDGLATNVPVLLTIATSSDERIIDTEPPEEFTVEITRDSDFFDNAWFLIFATQDKESGIDRYEVCEGMKCEASESPYQLRNQKRTDTITVRAIDRAGNIREAVVSRAGTNLPAVVLCVFGALLLVLFVLRRKIFKL